MMIKLLFVHFVCLSLYFFTIQQGTIASTENNGCKPPKPGPNNRLHIIIFDNAYMAEPELWKNLCNVINQFPEGTVTMEYKPGALAIKNGNDLTCKESHCNIDRYHGCELLHAKYINDCNKIAEGDEIAIIDCYCARESDKLLLANAASREKLGVPAEVVPTLVFNEIYDKCATIGSEKEIQDYICKTVYQNQQIGPC